MAVFDRAWRITYLNRHAKALTPGRDDLVGRVLWDAHPGLAHTASGGAYRTAMERGVPVRFEAYNELLKEVRRACLSLGRHLSALVNSRH